jgi:hypothetical protein
MESDRVNRFRSRQERLKNLRDSREEKTLSPISSEESEAPLDTSHVAIDKFCHRQVREKQFLTAPIEVDVEDATRLIEEIRSRWNQGQLDTLLTSCRDSVTRSIVGPFGLGGVVAKFDKDGGNVTTPHNAKKGIYEREADEFRRSDYVTHDYKKSSGLYKSEMTLSQGVVVDEYTGELISANSVDCDHITSTKQFHDDGGFMLSEERKRGFGSDSDNFALTSDSANRSKGDKPLQEWAHEQATDGTERTNKERYELDGRRINPAQRRGDLAAEKHAPTLTEKASYYTERAVATGLQEAGKMGLQQSFGLLLTEFFSACFDEISDSYRNGFRSSLNNQSFFDALRQRLARIVKRVANKWKDVVVAFKEGAISGFLSNLVTMLINTLVTTGKRIVRVIREGLMSIMKALKMALFPPKGMSPAEAADAALKLLATGLTVSLGILAEEAVEKSVSLFLSTTLPILAPFAGTISAVFVGAMTGIASALLVYGLDKLDIFGVNEAKKHAAVLSELDAIIVSCDAEINEIYDSEMNRMNIMLEQLRGA